MISIFSKPSFTNHISDSIEIGFHPYGPTITMSGIMTSPKKIVLVESFQISLILPEQEQEKQFDWFTLQPHSGIANQPGVLKTPSKFILSPNEPYRYSIMFVDNDHYANMKNSILSVLSAWTVFLENQNAIQSTPQLYRSFYGTPMAQELRNIFEDFCYWKAGTYIVTVCITTKSGSFKTKKAFSLNDEDVDLLRKNSSSIIASICRQQNVDYNTVKTSLIKSA